MIMRLPTRPPKPIRGRPTGAYVSTNAFHAQAALSFARSELFSFVNDRKRNLTFG
jgi:hypothetical protein